MISIQKIGRPVIPLLEEFCSSKVSIALTCHLVTPANQHSELWAADVVNGVANIFASHEISSCYSPFALMTHSADAVHQVFKAFKSEH